jgi:hypothetical protein
MKVKMPITGKFTNYTGLLIRGADPKEELRKATADWPAPDGVPFITIETPCGHTVEYQTVDDVPMIDTPCPCGDVNHWLIKIESEIG